MSYKMRHTEYCSYLIVLYHSVFTFNLTILTFISGIVNISSSSIFVEQFLAPKSISIS